MTTLEPAIMPPSQRRFLRYWAFNMVMVRSWGWAWTPGFRYSDSEWRRFDDLAKGVSAIAAGIWLTACTIIFIVLAALAIVALLLPVATWLWPDPAQTPALGFVVLLALVCFLSLGFGFPASVIWGGMIADRLSRDPLAPAVSGDAELAAKVRRQLWRLIVLMCVILIPGTMLFIIFDVHAGPLMLILKALVRG